MDIGCRIAGVGQGGSVSNEREYPGPARIWRDLTAAERTPLALAFWADADSAAQQVEAVHAIARQFRFRPQRVLSLPPETRVRQLASLHQVPDSVASRALVVYHLASEGPMLEAFLNRVGISHEGGVIADASVHAPAEQTLREATAALAAEFPGRAVRLYLMTLAAQDSATWGALPAILNEILPAGRPE